MQQGILSVPTIHRVTNAEHHDQGYYDMNKLPTSAIECAFLLLGSRDQYRLRLEEYQFYARFQSLHAQ